MGFSQGQVHEAQYNLDDPVERDIIKTFESELEVYEGKKPITVMQGTIFEKKIGGYELYLHEKDLFRYTRKYPNGAVVAENIGLYRDAEKRKRAVDSLRYRRKLAQDEENRRFEGTVVGQALEALGGRVVVEEDPKKELAKERKKLASKIKV